MDDVLTIAHARQRELREQIAEIDEFIRVAENLLRDAKPAGSGLRRERPETPVVRVASDRAQTETDEDLEQTAAEDEDAGDEMDGAEEADEAASGDTDSGVRKFPWTGVQPAVRRTGSDDSNGPTRRNIFRRDASAAG